MRNIVQIDTGSRWTCSPAQGACECPPRWTPSPSPALSCAEPFKDRFRYFNLVMHSTFFVWRSLTFQHISTYFIWSLRLTTQMCLYLIFRSPWFSRWQGYRRPSVRPPRHRGFCPAGKGTCNVEKEDVHHLNRLFVKQYLRPHYHDKICLS